jgi:hypothetical protein
MKQVKQEERKRIIQSEKAINQPNYNPLPNKQ